MNSIQKLINRPDFPFDKALFLSVLSLVPQALNQAFERTEKIQNDPEDILAELDHVTWDLNWE